MERRREGDVEGAGAIKTPEEESDLRVIALFRTTHSQATIDAGISPSELIVLKEEREVNLSGCL